MRLIIIVTATPARAAALLFATVLALGVCSAQPPDYAPVRAELEGGTTVYSVTTPVFETTQDTVYQTERYGPDFTYILHGLPPGPARLKLGFCENRYVRRGERVFDVSVDGTVVLDNFRAGLDFEIMNGSNKELDPLDDLDIPFARILQREGEGVSEMPVTDFDRAVITF